MKKLNNHQRYVAQALGMMRMDQFEKFLNDVTPNIYSCIILAMHERGDTDEQIAELICRTNEIWQEKLDSGSLDSMAEMVLELTGIDVRNKVAE